MYINNGARTGLARVTLHCGKVNFRAFAFPCFFLKFFYLFVINVYGVSALCGMDTPDAGIYWTIYVHSSLRSGEIVDELARLGLSVNYRRDMYMEKKIGLSVIQQFTTSQTRR